MADVSYTLEEVISNMKWFIEHYGKATRKEYRAAEAKGALPESVWGKHFKSFTEFKESASAEIPKVSSEEEKHEYKDDVWEVSIPKTSIHTLDELLTHCKVDTSIWRVERFVVNKWEMGAKNADGDVVVTPLFQVKATLVQKTAIIAARQEIEDLKRDAKELFLAPYTVIKIDSLTFSGNCLEILIPDLHAGKFAWSKETGHPDYDTPTAIETYERALDTVLARASHYVIDEIVLGVGNDLLNADDYNSQTTKGTLVNSDTRYQKTYKAVRQMVVRAIEKCRTRAKKVVVKVIPGNHDTQSTFTLGDSLECWFHNYSDVEIDNAPTPHKFYVWGKVLLGFTHGDKGKKADYGLWMATERPEDFGKSKFREIHIGHTHGLKVDEKFGVRVRTFAALCPPDAWHSAEHFVGNLRQAEAIVWNKEAGRIAEFIHTELD
jgi:hypothetical protein